MCHNQESNYAAIWAKWARSNRVILIFEIGEKERNRSCLREKYWKTVKVFCTQIYPHWQPATLFKSSWKNESMIMVCGVFPFWICSPIKSSFRSTYLTYILFKESWSFQGPMLDWYSSHYLKCTWVHGNQVIITLCGRPGWQFNGNTLLVPCGQNTSWRLSLYSS